MELAASLEWTGRVAMRARVHLHGARLEINDPVFERVAAAIEGELGFAITAGVLRARTDYLDDEFGSQPVQVVTVGGTARLGHFRSSDEVEPMRSELISGLGPSTSATPATLASLLVGADRAAHIQQQHR